MFRNEKKQLEKDIYQKNRYLEARRGIEASEKAIEEDHEKTVEKLTKRKDKRAFEKKQEAKKALKEEKKMKRKLMYDAEMKELERLSRPAYVDKREPTGKEAGELALQRQRETKILSDKRIKQETEKHETWVKSEEIRMAELEKSRRLQQLENEANTKELQESLSVKKDGTDTFELYGIQKKSLLDLYKKQHY